jgi:hypothetical protein
MQDMDAAIASLKMDVFVGVILSSRLPPHIAEGHAKTFGKRDERRTDFSQ